MLKHKYVLTFRKILFNHIKSIKYICHRVLQNDNDCYVKNTCVHIKMIDTLFGAIDTINTV